MRSESPASRRFWPLVLLLVVAGFGLRAWNLGSDPSGTLSTSNSELMDGPWYLAEALDATHGREADVFPHYDTPIYTALGRVAFSAPVRSGLEALGYPSALHAAHLMVAVLGALGVLLLAGAGRAAFGPRAGLLAALFWAIGFVPVGYGRATVVYGPLAVGLAGAAWLYTAGMARLGADPPRRRALGAASIGAALALAVALAAGLKSTAILAVPGLAIGLAWRWRRRWRLVLALLVPALALGVLAAIVDPSLVTKTLNRARGYLGAEIPGPVALAKRILNAPWKNGLVARAPVLLLLGWLGGLAAFRRAAPVDDGDPPAPDEEAAASSRHAATLGLWMWLAVWLFVIGAFEFSKQEGVLPLRHMVGALVPAALLAGAELDRLLGARGGSASAPRERPAPLGVTVIFSTLVGYWALGAGWKGLYDSVALPEWTAPLVTAAGMLASAAAIGLAAALGARSLGRRAVAARAREAADDASPFTATRPERTLAGGAILAFALLSAAWLLPVLARPTYTLRAGNIFMNELLGPGARLGGNWAHALGYDAADYTRHLPPWIAFNDPRFIPALHGYTHIATDASLRLLLRSAFAKGGAPPPIPITILDIRRGRSPVVIYRMPWAESEHGYVPTDIERALEAEVRAGRTEGGGED